MMVSLPLSTWLRLIIWLAIGMAIYFGYGRNHSRVQAALSNRKTPSVRRDLRVSWCAGT